MEVIACSGQSELKAAPHHQTTAARGTAAIAPLRWTGVGQTTHVVEP